MKKYIYLFSLIALFCFACQSDESYKPKVPEGEELRALFKQTKIAKQLRATTETRHSPIEQRSDLCQEWVNYTGNQDCCYVGMYASSPTNCILKIEWFAQNCFKNYDFYCWIYKCNGGDLHGVFSSSNVKPCYGSNNNITFISVPRGSYYFLYALYDPATNEACGMNLFYPCVSVSGNNCQEG